MFKVKSTKYSLPPDHTHRNITAFLMLSMIEGYERPPRDSKWKDISVQSHKSSCSLYDERKEKLGQLLMQLIQPEKGKMHVCQVSDCSLYWVIL